VVIYVAYETGVAFLMVLSGVDVAYRSFFLSKKLTEVPI